jgi:hypothetical protein
MAGKFRWKKNGINKFKLSLLGEGSGAINTYYSPLYPLPQTPRAHTHTDFCDWMVSACVIVYLSCAFEWMKLICMVCVGRSEDWSMGCIRRHALPHQYVQQSTSHYGHQHLEWWYPRRLHQRLLLHLCRPDRRTHYRQYRRMFVIMQSNSRKWKSHWCRMEQPLLPAKPQNGTHSLSFSPSFSLFSV